jgi:hypothetical protein
MMLAFFVEQWAKERNEKLESQKTRSLLHRILFSFPPLSLPFVESFVHEAYTVTLSYYELGHNELECNELGHN